MVFNTPELSNPRGVGVRVGVDACPSKKINIFRQFISAENSFLLRNKMFRNWFDAERRRRFDFGSIDWPWEEISKFNFIEFLLPSKSLNLT